MIKGPLLAYASKNDYNIQKGKAYKLIDIYYVTLSEEYGYKRIVISISGEIDLIRKREIETFVNDNIINYRILKFRWNDNNIEICFKTYGGSKTVARMDKFLNEFIVRLKNGNVNGSNQCFYCHRRNDQNSSLFCLDGVVMLSHEHCMEEYKKVNGINVKKHYNNGKIISGLLGSIYGAIIGSILLLVSVFVDYPIFILAIFSGILSRFYYDVCDGYKNYLVKLVCIVASCFASIFGAYYLPLIVMKKKFEFSTSFILALLSGFAGCFINLKTKGKDKYPSDRLYRIK